MIKLVELKGDQRKIIYAVIISIVIFIIGVFIYFIIVHFLPGNPVMQYLFAMGNLSPTPADILAATKLLGFDQPIIIQFFRYLGDLFIGDWGISVAINVGMPVTDLLHIAVPRTIELIIFP